MGKLKKGAWRKPTDEEIEAAAQRHIRKMGWNVIYIDQWREAQAR